MFSTIPFFALGLAVLAWPYHAFAIDMTRYPELVAKLKTAATQLDRDALLPNDSDWLYDFTVSLDGELQAGRNPNREQIQDYYTFSPGGVVNANAATFPAVTGNGMTSE